MSLSFFFSIFLLFFLTFIFYLFSSTIKPNPKLFQFNFRVCVSTFQIFFLTFIFLIFTLFQPFSLPYHFISPLLLQSFFLPYLFISPLPSILISFFLFLFIFLYFCFFLFTPSYYKFVTISSILCTVFPHKKKKKVPSLSLSKFFGGFFFSCISTLG